MAIVTGSVINEVLMNRASQPPAVGMGATELCWTDRHAYTVVEVAKTGKRVAVTRDAVTRTDANGLSEMQDWTCTSNPEGPKTWLRMAKDGRWRKVGNRSQIFLLGRKEEYYDPCF